MPGPGAPGNHPSLALAPLPPCPMLYVPCSGLCRFKDPPRCQGEGLLLPNARPQESYLLHPFEQREPLAEMWDPSGQPVLCQTVGQARSVR